MTAEPTPEVTGERVIGYVEPCKRGGETVGVPVILHDDGRVHPRVLAALKWPRWLPEPPEIIEARATLPDTPCVDHFAVTR